MGLGSIFSDFIRQRDFDFRQPQVTADIAAATRARHVHDFSALAKALTGDEIGANLMMLGHAWQSGLVPLAKESILEAIRLNGVAVTANAQAFDWGRRLAHDPAAVTALAHPPQAPELLTLTALIAARAAHLRAWQDDVLATRYRAALDRLPADEALRRSVAEAYAKVLAPKDEYEVARLYSLPAFREGLEAEFAGDFRLSLNLAPPFLPGTAPDGRPKKRSFRPWIFPVLRLLARLKPLRGTWADPFRHSADRKLERHLLALYEADLARADHVTPETLPLIRELLGLPLEIRGYGPVKEAAFAKQMARRAEILALLDSNPVALAAE